jgi:hypothetical protein
MLALFRRFEAVFQQGERGILVEEDWAGLQASMLLTAQLPFMRQWWPSVASLFSPSFRRFVESLQRQPAAQQGAAADAAQLSSIEPSSPLASTTSASASSGGAVPRS